MSYLPAEAGKVSDADGKAFGELLATLPAPVLAYCRTGMRSTTMWALVAIGHHTPAANFGSLAKSGL
jgi:sulfide:quinone oxidoreductase